MEREQALKELETIKKRDLVVLAAEYGIPIVGDSGKKNKGWAGHTLERHLKLPLNSLRAPNFGSWELKSCSLKLNRSGVLQVKETVAITMFDPVEIRERDFEDSHLYTKLRKMVLAVRVWEAADEPRSYYLGAYPFDLDNHRLVAGIKADYDLLRQTVIDGQPVSGKIGTYIQSRPKGAGGNAPRTRAFYAKTGLVAELIDLDELNKIFAEIKNS